MRELAPVIDLLALIARVPQSGQLGTCKWTWKNRVFHKKWKNCISSWNWGGPGVSGRSARTIRNFSLELWQDLVLLNVRKSTFQHLTVNWHLNVLEMALKTLHFVKGLSRTPLLFIPRYYTNIFSKIFCKNKEYRESKTWKSGNPKTQVH